MKKLISVLMLTALASSVLMVSATSSFAKGRRVAHRRTPIVRKHKKQVMPSIVKSRGKIRKAKRRTRKAPALPVTVVPTSGSTGE